MALELTIRDSPNQDLERFAGQYVYRIRIERRPDVTLEEAFRRSSIVAKGDIPFLEFDLPSNIVCPGCAENWQKSQAVMALKREPAYSSLMLIHAAINFGVLRKEDVSEFSPPLLDC